MAQIPIQLSIDCIFPKGKIESLTCTSLLRVVPGSREVYEASWDDRAVIAKVFFHKIKARYHLRREWRGLNLLQDRGLNCIRPLFCGHTDDGRWAVVVEKVLESETAKDIFENTSQTSERLKLLRLICEEIAKQHEKGVLQKDLHLGNFLLRGETAFALDPGTMKFFSHPIPRLKGISQLAMLTCYLPDEDTPSMERMLERYLEVRKWQVERSDAKLFQKQRTFHKTRAIRKSLEKTLRTSRQYRKFTTSKYVAVFDRSFCSKAEAIAFMNQIDGLMDAGSILKNGHTCYVFQILWNNREVVVKRYNHKSLVHSFRHTIKGSRARRGWLYGHRLGMLNISTPRPLAFIEQRRGLLMWRSYLVTEYVEGQRLNDFLRDSNVTEDQRSETIQQIMKMIYRLGESRISHGDLKHSNVLITILGPVLTDLDSMKISGRNWLCSRRRSRDIRRFNEQ